MSTISKIGERLRELRGDISLREIERRSGVSHTYISSLEKGADPRSGNVRAPSIDVLSKLAKCYDVRLSELLYDAELDEVAATIRHYEALLDFSDVELRDAIEKAPGIVYNGRELSTDDRRRALAVLDALFPIGGA